LRKLNDWLDANQSSGGHALTTPGGVTVSLLAPCNSSHCDSFLGGVQEGQLAIQLIVKAPMPMRSDALESCIIFVGVMGGLDQAVIPDVIASLPGGL
jgi:hypothetical protein